MKWFYPAQERIKEFLNEHYGEEYQHNFQDVCDEVVHENFRVRTPAPDGWVAFDIHFVIHRPWTGDRGIIKVYNENPQQVMQYEK